MAKKAELKNVPSLQGVSIFRNGLLPTQEVEAEPAAPPVAPVTQQPAPTAAFGQGTSPAAPVQSAAVAAPVPSVLATPERAAVPPPAAHAPFREPATHTPVASPSMADDRLSPPDQKTTMQEEKKMLRSYHLPESLIQRLEDAQMVYQLRKEKTNKQDIVIEALTRYLDELERQGFFNILKALRA